MKITVLVDNNTLVDKYYLAEPGLSLFIEVDGKKILFDAGFSDVFLKNAQKMDIDLKNIDYFVLSHGHLDHSWGLFHLYSAFSEAAFEKKYFPHPKFICHTLALNTKISPKVNQMGSLLTEEKLSGFFEVQKSKEPLNLTENLIFLGEIPRVTDFEGKHKSREIIIDGEIKEDKLLDDTALVYKSNDGIVIITGCSHSGICNIIDYAKKITGDDRILDIIGGFHLLNPDKSTLDATLEFLENQSIKNLHACHCTDLASKISLSAVCKLQEVGVGLTLNFL